MREDQDMPHVKHLRVETEVELEALFTALELLVAGTRPGDQRHHAAEALRLRLHATPTARHGGIVHVEDANYLPTPEARRG